MSRTMVPDYISPGITAMEAFYAPDRKPTNLMARSIRALLQAAWEGERPN